MKFISSNNEVVLFAPTGLTVINNSHQNYWDVRKALEAGAEDDVIVKLLDVRNAIMEKYAKVTLGKVEVVDSENIDETGTVTIDGLKITGKIASMILDYKKRGIPYTALKNFWAKLQQNPQLVGKESLLEFLTANDVPLLPNGNFLAYKGVFATEDPNVFEAAHDRSFKYTLGQMAELPWEKCTQDVHNACGPGLHVGGFQHARGYGDTMIDCEINPADVVSVPRAEQVKLRACRVLPVRVNKDRKHYTTEYLDLTKGEIIKTDAPIVMNGKLCETYVPPRKSSKKTTWYKMKGKVMVSQRKVKCPGDGWTSTKPVNPVTKKAMPKLKLAGGKMRTWYRMTRTGLDRMRATTKPAGWSSHKPA